MRLVPLPPPGETVVATGVADATAPPAPLAPVVGGGSMGGIPAKAVGFGIPQCLPKWHTTYILGCARPYKK